MTNDHRKRILQHQEKVAAEQQSAARPTDAQLKIPLIGEVQQQPAATAKRKRRGVKKPVQLKLQ